MSWQVGSLLVVATLLAVGFGWYERSRPSARVLALVAALAALATVGRIAFAAFPNVKPTTDIALFAGYALGPVPGFAVGAVAALSSNFFFGQGPWTPWQMLAWGAVGVGGALLGRVAGRDLGRASLAAACGVAGFGFGAIMDAFQWTLGARQDLAHYLAVSASSFPFNLAHALGNVGFCLLLGPSFVRALRRYQRRLEVRWRPAAAAVALPLALAGAAALVPARADASAAGAAVAYLRGAQNADGGFGPSPGSSSTELHTGWVALGLAAAGVSPADVTRGGHSAVDYIRAGIADTRAVGDIERTVLAVRAAGLSARSFGGRDLVAALLSYRSSDGSFDSGSINHTAFGVLAEAATGAGGMAAGAAWLERRQGRDGGFGFAPGAASDVDDTGAVLEALGAAGDGGDGAASRAVRYLRAAQNRDGGFGQMAGDPSNAQSTAWAVQGLVAAGTSPGGVARAGATPLAYLESLQAGDGSIRYSRASGQTPIWVTGEALDALEQRAFPIVPAGAGGGSSSGGGTQRSQRPTAHRRRHRRHRRAHRRRHRASVAAAAVGSSVAPLRSASAHLGRRGGGSLLAAWWLWTALAVAAATVLRARRTLRRRRSAGPA